jgi:hypothetical protein
MPSVLLDKQANDRESIRIGGFFVKKGRSQVMPPSKMRRPYTMIESIMPLANTELPEQAGVALARAPLVGVRIYSG